MLASGGQDNEYVANRADLTRGELVDEGEDEDAMEAILVIMFNAPGAASTYMLVSFSFLGKFGSAQNSDKMHSKLLSCNNLRHHFLRLRSLAGFIVIFLVSFCFYPLIASFSIQTHLDLFVKWCCCCCRCVKSEYGNWNKRAMKVKRRRRERDSHR